MRRLLLPLMAMLAVGGLVLWMGSSSDDGPEESAVPESRSITHEYRADARRDVPVPTPATSKVESSERGVFLSPVPEPMGAHPEEAEEVAQRIEDVLAGFEGTELVEIDCEAFPCVAVLRLEAPDLELLRPLSRELGMVGVGLAGNGRAFPALDPDAPDAQIWRQPLGYSTDLMPEHRAELEERFDAYVEDYIANLDPEVVDLYAE